MAIGRRRTREGQRIIPLSERSMWNEECPSTSKETMQWNTKTEEWEKAVRNVRLQAVLLRSSMTFDKRKGIKEKKQEEGQVSLCSL